MNESVKFAVAGASVEMNGESVSKFRKKITDVLGVTGAYVSKDRYKDARLAKSQADCSEKLLDAKTELDIERAKRGEIFITEDGSVEEVLLLNNPIEDAMRLTNARAVQEEFTFGQIIDRTNEMASSKSNLATNDKSIDPDWFNTFKGYAKKAKKEEVKELWAKVLLAEVDSPGHVSARVLIFIQHLSKNEASLIELLMSLSSEMGVPYCGQIKSSLLGEYIEFVDILELESLGLITRDLQVSRTLKPQQVMQFDFVDYLLVIENKSNHDKLQKVNILKLTSLGESLFSILDDVTKNLKYIRALGGELSNDRKLKVLLVKVESRIGDSIHYSLDSVELFCHQK